MLLGFFDYAARPVTPITPVVIVIITPIFNSWSPIGGGTDAIAILANTVYGRVVPGGEGNVEVTNRRPLVRLDYFTRHDFSVSSAWQSQPELKPYIDRLEAANGLIECPQSKRLSLEMKQENKDAVKLYESEAYRVFSYRANVIAWLKGMVLYVAHGYKWSKEIADFVRWTQQYNLWCKMLYFGQQLEKELREEVEIQRQSGPQNLLELLPDEFTKEQYRQMRQQQGKSGSGDGTLRSWQSRGYIVYDEVSGRYCKTEEYKKKFQVS